MSQKAKKQPLTTIFENMKPPVTNIAARTGKPPVTASTQPAPKTPRRRFRYFNDILKENGFPFAWYIQRDPRKLVIGPKGYGDGEQWREIGLVTCGVGYHTEHDNRTQEDTHYALISEGISMAQKAGEKFQFLDVENKIPKIEGLDLRAFVAD